MSHRPVAGASNDSSTDLLGSSAASGSLRRPMQPNVTFWPSAAAPPSPSTAAAPPEVTQAAVDPDSPMDVALTILTVFVLSPLIVCSNSLLLAAFHRYKRLRTASNCLVVSLAVADLCIGLFLPFGVYFELSKGGVDSALACLLPYCAAIAVCAVSILSMTAIALDRYTALAQPLRYNNLITKATVGRYVAAFWTYALLLGATPILAFYHAPTGGAAFTCSFDVVGQQVRLFLFCALYAPCAVVTVLSYTYVYIVARYHAHAIYSVELSVRQNHHHAHHQGASGAAAATTVAPPRYGRTLAITVGLFLLLWSPFQACMLLDALGRTALLRRWLRVYLACVAFANSALNPWVYGYRNAEFRLAFQRILEDAFAKLGVAKRPKQGGGNGLHERHAHLGLHSCASNVRLCVSPNHLTMTTLLKPTFVHAPDSATSCCNGDAPTTTVVVVCETAVSSEIQ